MPTICVCCYLCVRMLLYCCYLCVRMLLYTQPTWRAVMPTIEASCSTCVKVGWYGLRSLVSTSFRARCTYGIHIVGQHTHAYDIAYACRLAWIEEPRLHQLPCALYSSKAGCKAVVKVVVKVVGGWYGLRSLVSTSFRTGLASASRCTHTHTLPLYTHPHRHAVHTPTPVVTKFLSLSLSFSHTHIHLLANALEGS